MTNDDIKMMTKDEVDELLVDATETIEVDISDDRLALYEDYADKIGVSTESLLSAVVTKCLKELIAKDKTLE